MQAAGALKAGVISTVEKIFQCAAHITQVLGGAQYQRVGFDHIFSTGIERTLEDQLNNIGLN